MKRKIPKKLIIIAVLTIVLATTPDVVSSEIENFYKNTFGENYKLVVFIILVLISTLLIFLTSDMGKSKSEQIDFDIEWDEINVLYPKRARAYINSGQLRKSLDQLLKFNNPFVKEKIEPLLAKLIIIDNLRETENYQNDRKPLIELTADITKLISSIERSQSRKYKYLNSVNHYLAEKYNRRLLQKINNREPIKLGIIPSIPNYDWEFSDEQKELCKDVYQAFNYSNGRLLVLGEAGTGKTVLMLELAIRILQQINEIPILVSLSTWHADYLTIDEWLYEIISSELNVSKRTGKEILENYSLVLLLDGLDEVQEYGDDFLEKLGKYGSISDHKFVVSSRSLDYFNLIKTAPIHVQLEIEFFKLDQIEYELKEIGFLQPEAPVMLASLYKNPKLKSVAEIPFYFNLLQTLFSNGKELEELGLNLDESEENMKNKIVKFYINFKLNKTFDKKKYTKYLKFLAKQSNAKHTFELLSVNYDWLDLNKRKKQFVELIHYSIKILPYIPIFALVFAIMANASLIYFLIDERINFTSYAHIILLKFLRNLLLSIPISLIFVSLIVFTSSKRDSITIYTKEKRNWSIDKSLISAKNDFPKTLLIAILLSTAIYFYSDQNLTYTLISFALVIVGKTVISMTMGVMYSEEDIDPTKLIKINRPYQRFFTSMRRLHFSILEHLLVRYLLWKRGRMPFKVVNFFNELVELGILESDGASWRFRHKILQDYFIEEKSSKELDNSTFKIVT